MIENNAKRRIQGRGFVAITTILIILVVILLVGLGVSTLGISEMKMALQKTQSSQSYFLANLCAENALLELKRDEDYAGDATTTIENGNCQILPIERTGGEWTIKAVGIFHNQTKKLKIIVSQVNPSITISSWEEAYSF